MPYKNMMDREEPRERIVGYVGTFEDTYRVGLVRWPTTLTGSLPAILVARSHSVTVAYATTVHESRGTTLDLEVVDISLCEITPGLTCGAVLRVQHSTASCSCPFGHRAIRGTTIPGRDALGADVLWHRDDHLVADAVKADSSHYYKYNTRQLVVLEH
ncbi:hypothetical protein E4U61_006595 [Claviceps capensis]|nr:hypothetical protein E4U61_006595 [Claviceps capensis]